MLSLYPLPINWIFINDKLLYTILIFKKFVKNFTSHELKKGGKYDIRLL